MLTLLQFEHVPDDQISIFVFDLRLIPINIYIPTPIYNL